MKKNILISLMIVVYATLLSFAHIYWNKTTGPADHVDAIAGELTLDQNLIKENEFIDLNGEWAFYPDELLMPEEVSKSQATEYIDVPSSWKTHAAKEDTAHGVGTYVLSIPASELEGDYLSLRVNKTNVAYNLYVNDELVSKLGEVSEDKDKVVAKRKPMAVSFKSEEPTIEIVLQVANFTYDNVGGIITSLFFGTSEAIYKYSLINIMLQVLPIIVFLIHVIYALISSFIGTSRKQSLFFCLLLILLTFMVLVEDDYLILTFIDLSQGALTGLRGFVYSSTVFLVLLLIVNRLKKREVNVKLNEYLLYLIGLIIIAQLFLPSHLARDYVFIYFTPWVIVTVLTLIQLFKSIRLTDRHSRILIALAIITVLTNFVWSGIQNYYVLNMLYYPFDLIIAVSIYGVYLSNQVLEIYRKNIQMESALLQAQIEPHFIFNTLNSIISLSYIDQERMNTLLRNFAKYLRFNFKEKNLDQPILLKEELEMVKAYIEIQQERFTGKIKLEWDIADDLADVRIPALSIQPLVENVILYAISTDYKLGLLSIKVKQDATYVYVEVTDDGPGMKQADVPHLLKNTNDNEAGVGLRNTHERLKRIYKGEGLTIKTGLGEGFTVSFKIPKNN